MAKILILLAIIVLAGANSLAFRSDATTDCLNHVQGLAQILPKALIDIKTFNISGLIEDGLKVQQFVHNAQRDCPNSNFLKFVNLTTFEGPQECLQDILSLVPQVQQLYYDILGGNITHILEDINKLIPLVTKTIKDCSSGVDRNYILNHFDSPKCQKERKDGETDLLSFVYAIGSKNATLIAYALPIFTNRIFVILQSCSVAESNSKFNFLEEAFVPPQNDACSDDIAAIVALIPQLIDHLQAGDIAAVIQDVTQLYSLLQKASEDCFQAVQTIQPFDYVNQTTVQDFAKCIQDIMAIIPKFQQLIADIAEGNFTVIINDIIALVPLVNQTIIDCGDAKKTTSVKYLINFYKSSECIEKIHAVRASIINMHMYIENRQTVKFQSKVPELVNLVKSTVQVCHKRRL